MATETIREFLVALGFKTDESALKKFDEGIGRATKAVVVLATAVETTALTIAAGLERFTANLSALYYEAQRVGTSARELKALDIAAQNLGANAGEAEAAVDALAAAVRTNPGNLGVLQGILGRLGLSLKRSADGSWDFGDALLNIARVAKEGGPQAYYAINQLTSLLGVQETTLNKLIHGNLMEEYEKALKRLGPGFDLAAKNAAKFQIQWRFLKEDFESIGADVFENVAKAFGFKDLEDFDEWLQTHHQEIVDTITRAIKQVVDAAKWIVREIINVITKLKEWDDATGGLSTKLIALAAILKVSGAGSLISGVIQLGAAFGRLAIAAAPALPVLAALAASVTAIYAAWKAMHGQSADNWISDMANSLVNKATGGKDSSLGGWIHDHLKPLGLRMNNPGNLKFAGQPGATLGARGFATFADPMSGLLAMGRQLELYGSRGINSIADILKIYAPASENNLGAYIKEVANMTGFGADAHLNLKDPQTLSRLMDAMILHEQGYNPYGANQVASAAQRAIQIQSTINVHGVQDPKKVKDMIVEQQRQDYNETIRSLVLSAQ